MTENENIESVESEEMTFIEHLEQLRWHLIRIAIAIVVFAIFAFVRYDLIFDTFILNPKSPDFWTNEMFGKLADLLNAPALKINTKPFEIININLSGQFATHIKVSLFAGLILASPYVIWEIWRFLKPALYETEQKYTRGAVLFSSILFMMGVLFGYFLIVPLSVHFLGGYQISGTVTNQINLSSYISSVTSILLAGGVIFELPILIYFLSKVGLVTPDTLKHYRRHSYVVLLLLSAIITPPDVFSQVMICIPLVILYEVSIKVSHRITKQNEALLNED